jgi:hypothetical protein
MRPSRWPLRGLLRMRNFRNAINGLPHAEERPQGASRSTHNLTAALPFAGLDQFPDSFESRDPSTRCSCRRELEPAFAGERSDILYRHELPPCFFLAKRSSLDHQTRSQAPSLCHRRGSGASLRFRSRGLPGSSSRNSGPGAAAALSSAHELPAPRGGQPATADCSAPDGGRCHL